MVAKQYKSDIAQFNATAKYWTETYAGPPKEAAESVKSMMEMGFSQEQCEAALQKSGGDVEAALNSLLG